VKAVRARIVEPELDGVPSEAQPAKGRTHVASYTKIRDIPFKWFIRVVGPHAGRFAGRDIPVARKDGSEETEKLIKLIWQGDDRDTGKPVAIYEFVAKPKQELDDEIPF
jgi:hypothetical protein